MEKETVIEGTENETPAIGAGDVEESKAPETTGGESGKEGEGGEAGETDETAVTEEVEGEHVESEHIEGEGLEGEHVEGESVQGEGVEGEHVEGEQAEGEAKEEVEGEAKEEVEGEELMGEELKGEHIEGEETEKTGEDLLLPPPEDIVEEEEYVPEPPPDPAEPYNFSDSTEALKAPFELRPDQLAEVEKLWELFQEYTPAYSDLDGYITEKELIYMLKSLLIMTYTVEQLQELIQYCCRPPHEKGYIFYDQFLKMITIRQRDFPIEEEIRSALHVFDPEKEGTLDRELLREVLTKQGHKMSSKLVDNLIKEVDMSNDGTIGVEDIVGTMCIDLNPEDLQLLRAAVYPPKEAEQPTSELGEDDYE